MLVIGSHDQQKDGLGPFCRRKQQKDGHGPLFILGSGLFRSREATALSSPQKFRQLSSFSDEWFPTLASRASLRSVFGSICWFALLPQR